MPLFKKNEEVAEKVSAKKPAAKKAVKATEAKPESMQDLYAAPASKTSEKKGARKVDSAKLVRAGEILVKPLITEKVTELNGLSKYVFEVSCKANKIEIAKAIEALYGIKPLKVNVICYEGKVKNYGRRSGKRKDWKKAVVTLPKNKTIDVYEGV